MATTTVYDNYVWRETTPGVWQRDADEAEAFYSSLIKLYEGSGRMHFAMTGHVSLTVDVPAAASLGATTARVDESLRAAWLRLRHEFPTIASQVRWDVAAQRWIKVYETVPDTAAQGAWLGTTFKSVSTGQTGVEWANSDPPAPPVATLFVVTPPQDSASVVRRDLVLRSPHDIIDGIGTLLLFNQFAGLVASALAQSSSTPSLLDGSETCRLSPPYRVAADVPPTLTPAQEAKLAALRAAKAQPLDTDPSIHNLSVPFDANVLLPSRHQRVSRTLSPRQTTALLAALKPIHATPTHAFHAAIALALRNTHLAQNPTLTTTTKATHHRYTNYLLRNERPSCRPPFNSPAHPAAVYHSVSGGRLTVALPATTPSPSSPQTSRECAHFKEEFLTVLAQIKSHYHAVASDADHFALAPHIWADATPSLPLARGGAPLPVPAPNSSPSVSISSMGVIDRLIQPVWEEGEDGEGSGTRVRVSVDGPWVTGEELGNGLGVFLGTFRGRMEVSAAFNAAWHTGEEVEGFLGEVVALVGRGLGVDLEEGGL